MMSSHVIKSKHLHIEIHIMSLKITLLEFLLYIKARKFYNNNYYYYMCREVILSVNFISG